MTTNKRKTNQKLKILEHLKSVKTHPTAEVVYKEVKKELPAISLATVYRNLNAMADEGEILRLEIEKEYHFDADVCTHQHFVCRSCGRISDIFQDEITEFAMKSVKGVRADCVTIIYRGICDRCGGGKNDKE